MRLIYDLAHRFPIGLRLGIRASYQARDELIGGFGGGANALIDF